MAADDVTSRAGRRSEADRNVFGVATRLEQAMWPAAVLAFLVGWIGSRAGMAGVLEGVLLHAPLLTVIVQTARIAFSRRPIRLGWLGVCAAAILAGASDVAFLVDAHDPSSSAVLPWVRGLTVVGSQLAMAAAALELLRGRRHRLPFTWTLDFTVIAAGGITYALVLYHWAADGTLSAISVAQLALAMVTTLALLQIVIAGAGRDQVILSLLAAMVLSQVAAVAATMTLWNGGEVLWASWFDPRLAWLAFAVALGAACWFDQQPARGWPSQRLHAFSAGSWTVPALCMAQAVVVLVALARSRSDRPPTLVTWAGVTLAFGLIRAVLSGRDLERLGRLASASHTDELSGLLNRRAITEELGRATATGPGALLLVDVDRFRDINQYLGHEAADDVLRQLGERLRRHAQPDEMLGRLGADEFVVVTTTDTAHGAMAAARRMRRLVEVPFLVRGDMVRVDLSVGVATWAEEPPKVDQLFSQAHEARRRARERGSAVERWDPDRDQLAARRLALVDSLRRSVRRDELTLHYQPKINTVTGEVVGLEALARWEQDGTMVAPDLFISMAEEDGLIADLTRSLMDQALGQLAAWDAVGLRLSVAVNLSPRNLLDPALPRRVTELLDRHRITGDRLVLEITETTLIPDRNSSVAVLERLRALGVRISIDDYGTGHAALTYLRDFVVDELKLDRSYVSTMLDDERTMAIVESTVAMGTQLGLSVVAEGVERDEEVEALTRCGCKIAQGYLFCRPLPAEELTAWLLAREANPPPLAPRH